MTTLARRPLGASGVEVTELGLGCAALAGIYRSVSVAEAIGTIERAYDGGVRYFDTAPVYGAGLSEERLGRALRGMNRDDVVLSSKVGYRLRPLTFGEDGWDLFPDSPQGFEFDFSRDGVRTSIDQSLQRLGTDHLDIVWIHDPDEAVGARDGRRYDERSHLHEVMDETYPTLEELREEGIVGAIGIGINQWQLLVDFVKAGDFDAFLLAGRYTLLDSVGAARELFPLCQERGTSIVVGGPYASGILATGAIPGATFEYAPADTEILDRVQRISAIAAGYDTPVTALALQFSLAHPAVASVIPGCRSSAEADTAIRDATSVIPAALWAELIHTGLLPADAVTPLASEGASV